VLLFIDIQFKGEGSMAEKREGSGDVPARKNLGTSRLGLYIVLTGWLAFLVNISQVFQWTDFDTALMSLLTFEARHIPMVPRASHIHRPQARVQEHLPRDQLQEAL
jgi:hypothetical protein